MKHTHSTALIVASLLGMAATVATTGVAMAQAPAKPGTPQPASNAPTLAGPKVSKDSTQPTLVQRELSGKVKRLDISPAEAAVRLMKLDDKDRAAVDEVLFQRAAMMDEVVKKNIGPLAQLAGAVQAGDNAEAKRILSKLAEETKELRARGGLQDELAGVLSPEQAGEMRAMVREYWEAIAAEGREKKAPGTAAPGMDDGMQDEATAPAQTKPSSNPDTEPRTQRPRERRRDADGERARPGAGGRPGGPIAEESLRLLGQEIKRSYDRVVTAGSRDFDELLKKLDLTDAQEAEIRRIVSESFTATAGNPTPEQKIELYNKVSKLLTKEQRAKLYRLTSGKP